MPTQTICESARAEAPGRARLLESELTFYHGHDWALNAFPRLADVIQRLRAALKDVASAQPGWRRQETLRNIFLLSCAVSDTIDDFIGGPQYDFSRASSVFGPGRILVKLANAVCRLAADLHCRFSGRLWIWRERWGDALAPFMRSLAAGETRTEVLAGLLDVLDRALPSKVLRLRPRVPAAFRSQDLAHPDAFTLGRKLADLYPDRTRPVLIAGLRTAGSYLAPLLRGYLETFGYVDVRTVTLRPKAATGLRERQILMDAARRGSLAVLIDEPVYSAATFAAALDRLKEASISRTNVVAVFPTHPNRQEWRAASGALAIADIRTVTIAPEEWHKRELLRPERVAERLSEYWQTPVADLDIALDEEVNANLEGSREPGLHWRLKRVYRVQVRRADRGAETRRVLAKSVGWGWLGYHAFLAGERLSEFVPEVLGLRDGILYMEWHHRAGEADGRAEIVETAAAYVSARATGLRLADDPTRDLALAGRHRGTDELAGILSGAYGWKGFAVLKRPRIRRWLAEMSNDAPACIDGKLRVQEWLRTTGGLLKSDFEHHAMGKHELNLTDPAYDLAEVLLHWKLSPSEEERLITRYSQRSGDARVASRLFLYKLLAGVWTMERAAENLKAPSLLARHREFDRRYQDAWNFLTIHTTRFCAGLCRRPEPPAWSDPLVVLDVDGVLDRQIFGFPCTTAAGMEAISLFASHGIGVALNTARSVGELKEYCRAYGFVGGVAEYGAFAWDAIANRERVLVDDEALSQIADLKAALRQVPGAFVSEDCLFSVKAHTYSGARMVPLPDGLVRGLMEQRKLRRLQLRRTYTDSTVTAEANDKGCGLTGFLDLAGRPQWPVVAVGDSEPDLSMFRVANQSFAPGQISCSKVARQVGCVIAGAPYQAGLLEIARSIMHPDRRTCPLCQATPARELSEAEELFCELLRIADRGALDHFLRAVLDVSAIDAFRQ